MVFEIILLTLALVGSLLAGLIDLKTTEIPDEIPYIMAGLGLLLNLIKSIIFDSYTPILMSCVYGISFLIFGFLLYFTGQWGGGDAKVLSALGFLLPEVSIKKTFFPFPISLLFNVFFIGAIYMIFYMAILSILNKKILKVFFIELSSKIKEFLIGLIVISSILFLSSFFLFSKIMGLVNSFILSFSILSTTIFLYLFYRFIKVVENVGFKRKIKVSQLKEGDVLDDSKIWEGLKKEEVEKIRKSGKKYVVIKEGVRFAPVFFISTIFTFLFGDFIFVLIKLIQ
ncbi:MAG: A24 family peptidase [Candidatus Aenigmatarchaeota archaeon]